MLKEAPRKTMAAAQALRVKEARPESKLEAIFPRVKSQD
jgi:hypothetical protein